MCSVTVRFHKDLEMAAVMVTEDYLASHIRKRPLYANIPQRPPRPESAFGPFPNEFKKTDYFDGNVHDRLQRIKPRKFPKAVFKGKSKTKKVFNELSSANNNSSNRTMPMTGPALHSAIKGNLTGVLAAKIRGLPARPSTAHGASEIKKEATAPPSGPGLARPLEVPRPKSAPPSTRMEAHKVKAIRQVEGYMKHQGRFAVPPSQLLGEFADHKLSKGLRRAPKDFTVPPAGAFAVRPLKATLFRQYYDRADLPISMLHRAGGNRLKWHVRPQDLDYHAYLPLFFDGLCEIDDPYRFMAIQGIIDLIEACPSKLLPCIPQIVLPLKTALDTRAPYIMCSAMKVLQHLILADPQIGQALVPYYRQLLPSFNLFKNKNDNRGDGIDFNQRRRLCLGDLIAETLELMELTGGPDAFINIKYMVPAYESSLVF